MKKELPVTLLLSSVFAYLLSYFEYYYVTLDGIPYREIYRVGFLGMPPYFLFPVAPAIALAACFPIINGLVSNRNEALQFNRALAISLANLLWALTLYDAIYYGWRSVFPLPTDPLAGFWITSGEASFLGLVNLFGTLWPTWYFATVPIVTSIYLAYYIS